MTVVSPARVQKSSIDTQVHEGNILVTHMSGHVTRLMAEARFEQFRARLGFLRAPRWILDQSRMEGFDPNAVPAGARWFQLFREHGGNELAIVSTVPGARMAAATLAFSVRINVTVFATLDLAYSEFGFEPNSRVRGSAYPSDPDDE